MLSSSPSYMTRFDQNLCILCIPWAVVSLHLCCRGQGTAGLALSEGAVLISIWFVALLRDVVSRCFASKSPKVTQI